MKSKLILAFVVLLVIAFVGCDTGNNSETTLQPRPKYLKITGVPVGKKSV
jgi:hypothetical protein